jgi:MFS transporter, DHA1 family, inner membrane transport protein
MGPAHERRVLAALLFGNFVIGTGVLLPAGMLTELAHDLGVSVPTAGTMMLASGVVVAIGAPVAAALTTTIDRRLLLTASMAFYVLCHLASAAASSFAVLILLRVFLAVPAAIFTPQAAATVSALLPPQRRSAAITTIFIGWSLASVAGVPLGGYVGHALGWRAALLIVAVLAVVATVAVAFTVPRNVVSVPLSSASWREVLTSKALMTVLLVTFINGTGQFTLFTYLTPYLDGRLTDDPVIITLILAWYGISATIGNVLATRGLALIGASRSALITLLIMATGMSAWGLLSGTLVGALFATTIWGFGTFATISIQQARLAGIAPPLTSASIALNTSAIYFGHATGSAIGGALIGVGSLLVVPYVGAAILVLAAAVSLSAERWEPRTAMLEPHAKANDVEQRRI